jgi:hypothetical protein
MTATIPAGLNITPRIGTIGLGAGINGASIGATNTGVANATGSTGGMMMTNRLSHLQPKPVSPKLRRYSNAQTSL